MLSPWKPTVNLNTINFNPSQLRISQHLECIVDLVRNAGAVSKQSSVQDADRTSPSMERVRVAIIDWGPRAKREDPEAEARRNCFRVERGRSGGKHALLKYILIGAVGSPFSESMFPPGRRELVAAV